MAGKPVTITVAITFLTGILVADVDGLHPQRGSSVRNLLPVLVGARLEKDSLALHALVSRQDVRRDRLVRVSNVRIACVRARVCVRV